MESLSDEKNQINNEIKIAKQNYYINAFDKFSGDTRKTWQTINELTCRKSNRTVINEVEYCGQKSENSLEAAEIFNTFFSEIGTNLSKDVAEAAVSYSDFLTETYKLFSFSETTLHMFIRFYRNFPNQKQLAPIISPPNS